ncbi:hypothetical protein BDA99DRAFT_530687 [Phascolomyces articulosus]|uniref:Uncharacterized protein n=1 Tax=Phascolomyces articulosus TaxID=60185 RepID=A0AAD5JYN9_9FUNG|nr:hypothetical protein BDA99DRAFT_530687 [Phascolomyces articulosus]
MESTTASTDQHRPITLKPFRKLSPWNLFIHLVFKGTDEERREWSALIQVSDPISGATDKEISTAYKKVKEDKALMEKLDKKLAIINNPVAPTCEEKRKEIIEKWMKDIVSRVDMMTKLFDFDITLLISPQREEDWQAEVARSTTKSSDYSIRKMGGIDEFVKGCKGTYGY